MPDSIMLPSFTARVAAIADLTGRIRQFELVAEEGELPPFEAGAHVDLALGNGVVRSYSLLNDPRERHRYVLAVLREPQGSGSGWMHDSVRVGDRMRVAGPRNAFALQEDAAEHILLAGGVGITPILSMAHRLEAIGARFRIVYCTRNAADTAYLRELQAWHAGRLLLHHDEGDPALSLDLAPLLRERAPGAHLYVCGPKGLVAAARAAAAHWPAEAVHVELFGSPSPGAAIAAPAGTDEAFDVVWEPTGQVVHVPADQTMLDALLGAGIAAPYVCKEGWCGNCQLQLVSGRADHRDEVLDAGEREAMDCVHSCVSRAMPGERLVVARLGGAAAAAAAAEPMAAAPVAAEPVRTVAGKRADAAPLPLTPRDQVTRTGKDPVLKPLILSRGTLLSADLDRARAFYEEFLGLECVQVGADRILVRDTDPAEVRQARGGPYWIMDVRRAPDGVSTNLFKHWGIDVPTPGDVERVQAFAEANKERLGLRAVRKPRMQHGTYSFYLQDFDSNWWEVECRPPGESTDEVFARGDGAF